MRARQGWDGDARARQTRIGADAWRGGGPARLGTVVSCLTARAARPPPGGHAQIRGSPLPFVVETKAPDAERPRRTNRRGRLDSGRSGTRTPDLSHVRRAL